MVSNVTTTGRWSEAVCPMTRVGSAAAAIHLHDVFSMGPYILSILVCTVLARLVNPPGASSSASQEEEGMCVRLCTPGRGTAVPPYRQRQRSVNHTYVYIYIIYIAYYIINFGGGAFILTGAAFHACARAHILRTVLGP
jgi:hypothetical protein